VVYPPSEEGRALADKRKWQRRDRALRVGALLAVLGAIAIVVAAASGQLLPSPVNDLFALGQGSGDTPPQVPIVQRAEPPFVATPLAPCGPGSRKQPSVDGRVPSGSATHGFICNMTLVSHQGTEGGFKVLRYIDAHGHECAFYDTTLLLPLNALNPGGGSAGVAVLDMSNPAHPVQTDTLVTPPMLSPHESLNLNARRGILAADNGNPATEPGWVDFYDVRNDCRHPVLDSTGPFARLGHESGFSSDGKTFYATSTAYNSITAIDVSNPKSPHDVWEGNIFSHGMSLSDDGNRAYIADPHHNLLILDTSQIQARKPNPKAREISRLTWTAASIPQNAIPFSENGHPYLLEIDEYNQSTLNPGGNPDMVGAARIIDISNETQPFVVANLRLAIDQPAEHHAATVAGDPGTSNAAQGYAAHYCNVPTEVNPKIVACSFIASGLRVFDISNLTHPKEIAYYVAPPKPRSENMYTQSDFAMSKPAFAPARHEIWWTDGTTGFYVLRVAASVWPSANGGSSGASGHVICATGNRRQLIKAAIARHAHVRSVRATLGGHRIRVIRRGHAYYAVVNPRSIHGSARLVIKVRLSNGHIVVSRRVYRRCGHRRH
jgi:hypothetical protein